MNDHRENRPQRQKCPPHVRHLTEDYRLAREAYELALEAACRGHLGGDEELEYRANHLAPTFKDFLTDFYAAQRHTQQAA